MTEESRNQNQSVQHWRLVATVAGVLLAALPAQAQLVSQNFDTWPVTGAWSNYAHDGWTLSDGQVRITPGGFGQTLGSRSCWLNDYHATSNTWIQSPFMPHGVYTVFFQSRSKTGDLNNQEYGIETSPDGTNWTQQAYYSRVSANWNGQTLRLNTGEPLFVRIIKYDDEIDQQYLGIDDIQIVPPPGVILENLRHQPASPTATTPVHILVDATVLPGISNVVLDTWYRLGTAGVFTTTTMVPLTNLTFRTETAIPPGYTGIVQYLVACTYTGPGVSPTFMPEPGSNTPAYYDTRNPNLANHRRELAPSSHRTPLIISEIMYHPPDITNPMPAFIELFNTDPIPVDISGYRISGDVDYTFPPDTRLEARSFVVVAANPAAAEAAYGIGNVLGPYQGALPASGGTVQLRNRARAVLVNVTYDDEWPWPVAADGAGHSLVLAEPDHGEGAARAWRASHDLGGSPGAADFQPPTPLDAVVINEFMAHTDLPDIDYIELFNCGTQSVNIGGCTLSDTATTRKFTFPPDTILPPLGFLALTQTNLGFSLSSHGDDIFFSAPGHGRVIDAVQFPAQPNGVASGRFPDGDAAFALLNTPTPGTANLPAGLRPAEIVINEIHFHPLSGDPDDEFVELFNPAAETQDISGWRFIDGIDLTLPAGSTIPAGGYLVVARNLTNLLARYPQLNPANTVGNFSGQLADGGERLVLARPDDPLLPNEDFVLVDEVTYGDGDDWGHWVDGGGSSLELIDARADNRLPMNWAGSDETAKAPWTTVDYTGPLDNGSGVANELRLYLMQAGEFLLDDVRVESPPGTPVLDMNFESGLGAWQRSGNHSRSALTATGGFASPASLQVRASGPGNEGTWSGWSTDPHQNHVRAPLAAALTTGNSVRIQAKLRWLAGWPHLTMTIRGYWAEAATQLAVPTTPGTPGLPNSCQRNNLGPALSDATHAPILPAANESVVVSCRIDDPDGVANATMQYRLDPATNLLAVTLNDAGTDGDERAGDGRYSGLIPGQPAGTRVAFTITASDAHAAPQAQVFPPPAPPGAPPLECVIRFGQTLPSGVLGNYLLWMTDASINRWVTITGGNFSNEPIDFTFVYGRDRVVYNAGGRYRGLWRSYTGPTTSGGYSVTLPRSERFLGTRDFDLDQIGQRGNDGTRQAEGYCYWLARQIDIPAPETRYVRVNANGVDRGILHDLQTPGQDFYESWYEDPDPEVFKLVGWVGDPFSRRHDAAGNYKQSLYRWLLPKRAMERPNDNYRPVYDLVDAALTAVDATYEARMSALLDLRTWTGFFAVNGATAAWDHYGWDYTHNGFTYIPHAGGAGLYIYDMDGVLAGSEALMPGANWPVPYRMFTRPAFRRIYLALQAEILQGPMAVQAVNDRMDGLYNAFLANGASVSPPSGWKNWIATQRPVLSNAVAPYQVPFTVYTTGGPFVSTTNAIVTLVGTAPPAVADIRVNGIRNVVTYPTITNWSLRLGLTAGDNLLQLEACDWRGTALASNTITVTLTQPPPSPLDQILITEIMYHPLRDENEYVEIFNRSTAHAFDLRGWQLNGASFSFDGGSVIEPGRYAVIARSRAAYQHTHGNAEVLLGAFAGTLDDGGETLQLRMPDGSNGWIVIDEVRYDDDPPWPAAAAGGGQSLQLLDLNQDNSRPGNWGTLQPPVPTWKFKSITGTVSNLNPLALASGALHIFLHQAGAVQVDRLMLVTGAVAEAGANLIQNGDFESALSGPWQTLGNHAGSAITDAHALSGTGSLHVVATGPGAAGTHAVKQAHSLTNKGNQTVTLSYWYRESAAEVDMTVALSHSTAGLTHNAAVPSQPEALFYSPGAASTIAQPLPDLPPLWINEIMPANLTAWSDAQGDFDPWIELFNASTNALNLAEFRLSNDPTSPDQWAFGTGTVVAAGARLLIWADGEPGESLPDEPHADFILNPITGTVVLARMDLGRPIVLDSLTYAAIGTDFSYGSYPEGDAGARQVFHTPTPGLPNTPESLPLHVTINEWMTQNQTTLRDPTDQNFEDWFELYNPASTPVNLGGYFLTDNLAQTNQFRIPGGRIIPPRGFMLVWADEDDDVNAPGSDLHTNFRLSASGESLALFRPDGVLVDAVTFGPQSADRSEGAWPDGAASITRMQPPTPGASNAVLIVASLAGTTPDQFEMAVSAVSGGVYTVHFATNLIPDAWEVINVITATAPTLTVIDTNAATRPTGFYRLQRLE